MVSLLKRSVRTGIGAEKGVYAAALSFLFEHALCNRGKGFRFSAGDFSRALVASGAPQFLVHTASIQDFVRFFRSEARWPKRIKATAPRGKTWIITGRGDAVYEFRLITTTILSADPGWFKTKVPDATPEIVECLNLSGEQLLLARIRYNRLVDLFCRCVAHPLQNHLRTTVKGLGQIEIDELYVGANRLGQHFIIPVQAKKEKDRLGVSQLIQDYEYCKIKHPGMIPRLLAVQLFAYKEDGKTFDRIAICEFVVREIKDDLLIEKSSEEHFLLLPKSLISQSDFEAANIRADKEGQ